MVSWNASSLEQRHFVFIIFQVDDVLPSVVIRLGSAFKLDGLARVECCALLTR